MPDSLLPKIFHTLDAYVLAGPDGRTPVPVDVLTWARWSEINDRMVARSWVEMVPGAERPRVTVRTMFRNAPGYSLFPAVYDEVNGPDRAVVSTVFLGIDHRWASDGDPVLFESMIFWHHNDLDQYQMRYASYADAEVGHHRVLKRTVLAMLRDGIDHWGDNDSSEVIDRDLDLVPPMLTPHGATTVTVGLAPIDADGVVFIRNAGPDAE